MQAFVEVLWPFVFIFSSHCAGFVCEISNFSRCLNFTTVCFPVLSAAVWRISDPWRLYCWDPKHLQPGYLWQRWDAGDHPYCNLYLLISKQRCITVQHIPFIFRIRLRVVHSACLVGQEPVYQTPLSGQELQQHQIQVRMQQRWRWCWAVVHSLELALKSKGRPGLSFALYPDLILGIKHSKQSRN